MARVFLLSNDWFGCIVGKSAGDDEFAYRTLHVKRFLASFFLSPPAPNASNAVGCPFKNQGVK